MFEFVGSVIALTLFVFSYIHLKKIRHHETTTYFDGMDGIHAGSHMRVVGICKGV
ncbi:hypothetical protein KQ1_01252 [Bacillus cereus BAG3O-1]|nr:hypothetical protein KQ1_01252 [Bacillus cereus BAG3O-1]